MRQPLGLTWDMTRYVIAQRLRGRRRYPLVLMLEPTELCNLTCTGCGKIRQDPAVLQRRLSVEECLAAVDECGAPAVSIAGGEPLTHPDIVAIVEGILARRKLTLLCTNGILLGRVLPKLKPHPRFSLVFHLDGPREHHDRMVERRGVYDLVIKGIAEAKKRGFRVTTNTTLYKGADPKAVGQLLRELNAMGVDNCIVSPAFTYEEVGMRSDIFLRRKEAIALFRAVAEAAGPGVRYYNTPVYLDFLMGKRHLRCTPWGNPTRDPLGWKGPCYLLTDRHYQRFDELMTETRWEEFGYGENPRCASCMMHSGYEASAVSAITPRDAWRMVRWLFAS
ncbi:MAG: adenosyl-hopene transferase HpnH [Firmicutes bacterium]|nr:adenosyl-hopene transferase HpnH [Alicyclobacillaceae bacterium]MCL6498074.1 adenosyl-hopene transferase HpnH [Bacillota bacterium]